MQLNRWFRLCRLPTGRRSFALRQLADLPGVAQVPGLAALVTTAREHTEEVQVLENRYRRRKTEPSDIRASRLDARIDATLGSIGRRAADHKELFGSSDSDEDAGSRLLRRALPDGVAAVMLLSYVEEVEAVGHLLGLFRGELADDIATLGLTAHVGLLARLCEELSGVIAEPVVEAPTYDQLRAARAQGHEKLLRVVVRILDATSEGGDATESGQAALELRQSLLAPIVAQNDAVHVYHRRRRAVIDIDPGSGQERDQAELDEMEATLADPESLG